MIAKSGVFRQGKVSCVNLLLKPNLFSGFLWEIRGCYELTHAVFGFSKRTIDINRQILVSLGQKAEIERSSSKG